MLDPVERRVGFTSQLGRRQLDPLRQLDVEVAGWVQADFQPRSLRVEHVTAAPRSAVMKWRWYPLTSMPSA